METKKQIEIAVGWHAVELGEVLRKFSVNPAAGLTTLEARERIKNLGQNILPRGKKITAAEMLIRQFTSPLVPQGPDFYFQGGKQYEKPFSSRDRRG